VICVAQETKTQVPGLLPMKIAQSIG